MMRRNSEPQAQPDQGYCILLHTPGAEQLGLA
jgi:hypothetical protein